MKDELGRKSWKKIVGLRVKTYSYLIDDSIENKKSKKAQQRKLKFENYENCLEATKLVKRNKKSRKQ